MSLVHNCDDVKYMQLLTVTHSTEFLTFSLFLKFLIRMKEELHWAAVEILISFS
jgi:hypothetical protein